MKGNKAKVIGCYYYCFLAVIVEHGSRIGFGVMTVCDAPFSRTFLCPSSQILVALTFSQSLVGGRDMDVSQRLVQFLDSFLIFSSFHVNTQAFISMTIIVFVIAFQYMVRIPRISRLRPQSQFVSIFFVEYSSSSFSFLAKFSY